HRERPIRLAGGRSLGPRAARDPQGADRRRGAPLRRGRKHSRAREHQTRPARPRSADRKFLPRRVHHGGARHPGAVLQLHAGIRLDAHRPRAAAARRLHGARLRRRRPRERRSVAWGARPARMGHGVPARRAAGIDRRISRSGRGAAGGQRGAHPFRALSQRAGHRRTPLSRDGPPIRVRQRRPVRGAARLAGRGLRRPDASRSRPHDLGGDRAPRIRPVRSGARPHLSPGSVGSARPERRVSTVIAPPARRIGYRWTVCALLFVVTTINYVDRQVLGILAPTLQRELGWSEAAYGDVVSWFSLPYAFGFLAAGRLFDRIGVRRGFAAAVVAWSLAAIAHAFARTTALFSAARALLGVAESANFPGAIKAVAEWFPKKERALATGIFNAGTNTGAIVTPLLVPWIALTWGWQWAFIATGSLGFVWLLLWLAVYRNPESNPRVSSDELAH